MAGGIDTSNRKPRRLRGTPALSFINKYSLLSLAICGGLGYFLYTRPGVKRLETDHFSDDEIERANLEREQRRFMLSNQFVGQKTSSEIRQVLRHRKKSNSQLQSSQISRFFSHSNASDAKQNTQADTQNGTDDEESVDCSENIQNHCDNNDPLTNSEQTPEKEIQIQIAEKKKKHSHRSTKPEDSTSRIKSFFSNQNNDSLSDFEIPNKVAKKIPKPLPSKTAKGTRTRRKQPDIRKALSKKDAASGDYSHLPEGAQLELALAMSKAVSANGTATDASGQPIDLDCFEFKPTSAKVNADFLDFFNMNRKAKARFKWNSKCTQLTRRKDDVQQNKAREKIDEILLNNIIVESNQSKLTSSPELFTTSNYTPYEIHSRRLQRICITERILFELNGCDEETWCNIRSYYTNNLVEPSEHKAGVLLKDWSTIPGRDSIYDGITESENEMNKTESAVISSSPCFDIPLDDEETEVQAKCDDDHQIKSALNNDVADDRQVETAGCSNEIQQRGCSPMDIHEDGEAEDSGDENATLLMDSDDIQLKIDAINSKIRLSRNFSDILQPSVLTYEAATTTRALSPDLFDDDDDIDMTEEIQQKNEDKSPVVQVDEDEDTVEATSSEVVVISSEECNSEPVSNNGTQHKSQDLNTQKTFANINDAAVDVIELLDSDSEPMLKERIVSPITHKSEEHEGCTPQVVIDYNIWDDDYDNYMMQDMNKPNQNVHEESNQSVELKESATPVKKLSFTERLELFGRDMKNGFASKIPVECLSQSQQQLSQESIELSDDEINYSMRKTAVENIQKESNQSVKLNKSETPVKKLSFTERLELFENDMENGFTGNIPAKYLSQSQQQLSQESIDLSDDEINYSMRNGTMHAIDGNSPNMDYMTNDRFHFSSPIEFNFRDTDSNSNLETEEKLVNQSICNVLEKTFEQIGSPISTGTKRKSKGGKSLKKVNSETVLSSRYANAVPSTSGSNTNRFMLSPIKKCKLANIISPSKPNNSPISQPTAETRMDLSNDDYYIRVGSISPKPNYEEMDTATLETELRKYGLKPSLRRRQAIICLEYIYNRTHPFMESVNDLDQSPGKYQENDSENVTENNNQDAAENKNGAKNSQINFNIGFATHNLVDEKFKNRGVAKVFLPSVPRAKKPWCLEPLHIAWHNLMKANPELRKAVLLYEPINLIELKKYFKTIDMTFDNRDLIAFLDLHCITFRMIKPTKG